MLAAALYHARREDLRRAVLLAGYAFSAVARPKGMCLPILLRVQQRIHDGATATHPVALVDTWSHAGECFTDERAAAIAFDGAPLDELLE
ncbi:MAG: hypothetical protein ABI552_09275 [Casimicrobiaceae bacterium]